MQASSKPSEECVFALPVDEEFADWATVEEDQIKNHADRLTFRRRCNAALVYRNEGITKAAKVAKVSERNFRRLWKRCLQIAPDGRPWGFRAMVPRTRIHQPVRTAPFREVEGKPSAGFGGILGKLLLDHPMIREGLVNALGRLGREAYQPTTMKGRQLHGKFLELCAKTGLTEEDYPFNTIEKGRRSLHDWVKRVYLPLHSHAFVKGEHGQDAATAFDFQRDGEARRTPAQPWEDWQLDEVKIDVYARYEFLSSDFVPIYLELPRIVAIVCKDTSTGAVPAWKLVLAREVNVGDLLEVIWMAVSGPRKVDPTVPESDYKEGAGFPAVVLPALRYAMCRKLSLDNALAHLADDLRNALEKTCGCKVVLGKPKTPLERAEIEAEFSALARKVVHQLPGTTGSGPKDPKRKKAALPLEGLIRVEELEHTMDVYFANRNGLPHAASNDVAPLERLKYALSKGILDPVVLPPDKRHAHVFGFRREVTVRADLSKGRRPFVNFLKLRYRGPVLTSFAGFVGKRLIVRASPLDLRTIVAFDQNGLELGTLRAEGKWGVLPHDLRIRNLFQKLRRENSLSEQAEDQPLRALFAHLNKGAQRDKTQAAQMAHLLQYLRGYPDELSDELLVDLGQHQRLQHAANDISVIALSPPSSVEPSQAAAPTSPAPAPQPAPLTEPSARPVYLLPQRNMRR